MSDLPQHLSGLVSTFGKNIVHEQRLADLNELLAPLEAWLEQDFQAPIHPVTFVLGPPRSGTTVTGQLIARSGLFGFISNFAARFWGAPALGLRIERDLGISDESLSGPLWSNRGATRGWREPSEFGYFWSRFFDLGQTTHSLTEPGRKAFDAGGLRRAVAAMEGVTGKPMAFKNNTWFTFHAELLEKVFPNCVLVVCRRDPFFIAQSLWEQRKDLYGDVGHWWSVRPPNYGDIKNLPAIEQIAAQAVNIVVEMERALQRVKSAKCIDACYARIASEPHRVIAEIASAAQANDGAIQNALSHLPDRLEFRDEVRLEPAIAHDLREAILRELKKGRASGMLAGSTGSSSEKK